MRWQDGLHEIPAILIKQGANFLEPKGLDPTNNAFNLVGTIIFIDQEIELQNDDRGQYIGGIKHLFSLAT